jgi:hypothetical protein
MLDSVDQRQLFHILKKEDLEVSKGGSGGLEGRISRSRRDDPDSKLRAARSWELQ